MAHERTELELGPGVNALTGPNNTGKSAIVEALRCVATNPVPKYYIRHGAKEARVSLTFEDGTTVVWIRKARSSGYELWEPGAEEPEEYWKFGRKPPEDVLDALKLDLVELETGGEIDVHVGNQREPVFLLNQPGSNAAAFFAASTESAHLLAMQNLLKRRTLDAKRTTRELEGRLAEIEAEMDLFSSLPDIGCVAEKARELESTANKLQSTIPVLENVLGAQRDLTEALTRRRESATILKGMNPVPNLIDTRSLLGVLGRIKSLDAAQKIASRRDAALAPLAPLPATHDTATLSAVCEQLQRTEKALRKAETERDISVGLVAPPVTENTTQLSELITNIITARYRRDRQDRRHNVLQMIVEPPEVQPDKHLVALLADIRDVTQRKGEAESVLNGLENQLQSMKETIARHVEAVGCCPTCGADINTEAFLDRRCRHDG